VFLEGINEWSNSIIESKDGELFYVIFDAKRLKSIIIESRKIENYFFKIYNIFNFGTLFTI